jgi:hypothetical protein
MGTGYMSDVENFATNEDVSARESMAGTTFLLAVVLVVLAGAGAWWWRQRRR